jgi:hypothetical protein
VPGLTFTTLPEPCAHDRQHGLSHGQDADDVQDQGAGEVFWIKPVQRQMQAGPGIVNERVNLTMTPEGGLRDSADITAVGDIGGDGQRSAEVSGEHRKAIGPAHREDRLGASGIEQPRWPRRFLTRRR